MAGGWLPIGDNSTGGNDSRFTAVFEGNGHTLSNLYIDRSARYVGLFGYLGVGAEVRNVGIEGGSVTTIAACQIWQPEPAAWWGITPARSRGSYATGAADATGDFVQAGGLVGWNEGTITSSYATGAADVTGDHAQAGGLVGNNYQGTISGCYATGAARCDRRRRPSRRPGGE